MNSEKVKYTFSGHDSFHCRQLWLKKGFDYLKSKKSFNDEDAVVKLGVGKNMVASIRFWMRAFNIINHKDNPTIFGTKLLDDTGFDPYLEDEGSLWLLHYQLVKNRHASTYNIIFNEFRKEKIYFGKDTFVNYLKRKRETESQFTFNEKTVADDFVVFVKMYQNNVIGKELEDSFSGILSDIDLLKTTNKNKEEQYQIENNEREKLPFEILLFTILDNKNYGDSISLNSLENDEDSPGSIFCLNRNGLLNKILKIVQEYKDITFTDIAGIKELQFKKKPDPFEILKLYYEK